MDLPRNTPRDRRPVPGSRAFCIDSGPAMVICGTRSGTTRFRERVSLLPAHYLMAPIDADPGSLRWPVQGAKGITLQVCGADADFVLRLTQILLSDGAELVVQIRDERPYASIHQRSAEVSPT